jgi:hypothetical protein
MRVDAGSSQVSIYTYGKVSPVQPGAAYVIDVMGLRDPMSNRGFRQRYEDGRPGEVQDYVKGDPRLQAIIDEVRLLAYLHVDCEQDKWISIGVRDFHGKWISPAVGELIAEALDNLGYRTYVYHYECEDPKKKDS